MANIKRNIAELIGKTPLLEIAHTQEIETLNAHILLKLELFNPNQSVKDRIALRIIEEAEETGRLHKGMTVVETTSGNTGIGLAGVTAAKGYHFRAYLPPTVSEERFQVIRALGGEAIRYDTLPEIKKVLEETGSDFVAAVNALKKILRNDPDIFFSDQCYNQANVEAHLETTGKEIWEDTDGKIDIVIITVGTGGTISGVGGYLKKKNPDIRIIAIQPDPKSRPSKKNPETEEIMGVHAFTDVSKQYIPQTLDLSVIDEVVDIETYQAYEGARSIAVNEGILVGISSGAGVYHAMQLAKKKENRGKNIVVVAPDTGLRYLSTNLFTYENNAAAQRE